MVADPAADRVTGVLMAGQTATFAVERSGPLRSVGKSTLDVGVALALLLFLLPLLLVVAALVSVSSPGPVIFRQRRTGLNGQVFWVCKFRTMHVQAGEADTRHASRGDARVTRLGALLRRTSIDELPQLWNVLCGDMSLVGPRPHALAHDRHYSPLVPGYHDRFRAKPGLTGLAQVSGLRGEIHSINDMARRADCDNHYIDTWSLLLDLQILARTAALLLNDPKAY